MSDLKTFWTNPVTTSTDTGGTSVTSSGSDPAIMPIEGGDQACKPIWSDHPVPYIDGQETANTVSGLPLQPNRFEPPAEPPPPPTLQDRRPGTIDQK